MTIYRHWETPKENMKRMERDVMLASRKRWRGPQLGKLKKIANHRIRGRIADLQNRQRVRSCGYLIYLRAWHEGHKP